MHRAEEVNPGSWPASVAIVGPSTGPCPVELDDRRCGGTPPAVIVLATACG